MSFYSPIDRLMEQSTRPKGTGAEYMTELSKQPGFKQAEVEDRDLQALLALPKMDRAAFMAQLKAKPAVMPSTNIASGTDDPQYLTRAEQEEGSDDQTYHQDYTLPGGTKYREILLQHPKGQFSGVAAHFGGAPNVLASIRVKDRVGPDGEKILHLEEIQSDWHQQGREKGYQPKGVDLNKEADKAKMQHTLLSQKLNEARQSSDAIDRNLASDQPLYQNPEVRERQKQAQNRHNESIMDLMPQVMKAEEAHRVARETARSAVPEAPFKKNWHELALKRMIHHAAENGYGQIHITPGEEQAKRYGLSKHVGMVSYNPEEQHFQAFKPNRETLISEKDASPERVSDLIGKEAANRLMSAPAQMGHHFLEGEDLNVGGEGMKGFYDKMVPKFLNQFGKKYGVHVQPGVIEAGNKAPSYGLPSSVDFENNRQPGETMLQYVERMKSTPVMAPTHRFDITPQMREDVLKNGMPLYAEGGSIDRGEGLRKFLEPSAEKRRMYHGTRHHPQGADAPYTMGDVMDFHKMTEDQWGEAKNREALIAQYSAHRKESMDMDKLRSKGGFSALRSGEREMSFVSPDTEFANDYAGDNKLADKMSGAVYPVHVQVKNPFDYENPSHVRAVAKLLKPTSDKWAMHYGKSPEQIINRLSSGAWEYIEDPHVRTAAQKLGHDAMYMTEHGVKNLGVFNPNAIKSATGNRGTYDINDPHMGHAEGGSIEGDVPRETVKAYKLFRVHPKHPGKLFPLFIGKHEPVEMNKWVPAEHIPTKGFAERPGWHAGDLPMATHIGEKSDTSLTAPDRRPRNQVWTEIEMPNDVDWQTEANKRGTNPHGRVIPVKAHITDQVPTGGHYRYKTNPNMTGSWLIGGAMKVNRILPDEEVTAINRAAKQADLPRHEPFNPKEFGFAKGGAAKPVVHGIIKERVTVSPNLDAMQYELMSAKHFTKKVK